MKRSEIRAFLKAGVDALSPSIKFNAGRVSEFASETNKPFPYVWVDELQGTGAAENPQENWEVSMLIAKLDKMDSLPAQYEALVDECDYIAQQLVIQYRNILTTSKKVSISDTPRVPFIKRNTPDVTTGVTLTFTIADFSPVPIC